MFFFSYLSGSEELDYGPFSSREEAQEARERLANLGAICSEVKQVDEGYRLYKGEYAS
jgi:hypothetical protein